MMPSIPPGVPFSPLLMHIVKPGDYIIGINGQEIGTKGELIDAVASLDSEEVILTINAGPASISSFTAVSTGSCSENKVSIRSTVPKMPTSVFFVIVPSTL